MTGVLMQDDGAQAGKVDLGGKFYVSPGKVYAKLADEPFTSPVTLYNRSGTGVFHLALITPMGLSPGYKAWDGESYDIEFTATVTVPVGSSVDVPVTITRNARGGKQEAWLTVFEPDDAGNLKHELVIRILMEG